MATVTFYEKPSCANNTRQKKLLTEAGHTVIAKSKLGGVFGSYGWTGEGVEMVEDRLRGLKLRVPIPGIRIKLIPTK
jgi:flavorubredoxin